MFLIHKKEVIEFVFGIQVRTRYKTGSLTQIIMIKMEAKAYINLAIKFYLQLSQPSRSSHMPNIFLLDRVYCNV